MLLVVHFPGVWHLGSLKSTQEDRFIASGGAVINSQAFFVLSRLIARA